MKKIFRIERLFTDKDLITFQSFITQSIDGVFLHKRDYKSYNNQDFTFSVSFKPRILMKFSSIYYEFRNEAIIDKCNDLVHKLVVDEYNLENINEFDKFESIEIFPFNIEHIDIYSMSYESYSNDYTVLSDVLIILISDMGYKIGILAYEHHQDSILFWYNTKTIETKLLLKTFQGSDTYKFQKRIAISRDKITHCA